MRRFIEFFGVMVIAMGVAVAQGQLTITTNCNGNSATATLFSITYDPCVCTSGNASITTCASCAMEIRNTTNYALNIRTTTWVAGQTNPPQPTPQSGGGTAGLPANSNQTINPISLGLPVGDYNIWVLCPCGAWVLAGEIHIRNC